jgi:hypothetical protein
MEFQADIIFRMPERNQKTFHNLLEAWNRLTDDTLKLTPKTKTIKFHREGLSLIQADPGLSKSLRIFRRVYGRHQHAPPPIAPSAEPKVESKTVASKQLSKSRSKTSSKAASSESQKQ